MTTTPYSASSLIDLENRFGARNYHPLDVVLTRGEGCWVWDVDGNRYLDCLAAYSAVNQGHCHPEILSALVEQARKLALTSRAFRNDQLGPYCQELSEATGFARVLPMNSGAEAVETAIKAVRKWGYTVKGVPADKAEIIVSADNFHGRTTTIISFSTEKEYREGFGPFTPGFKIVEFGDADAFEQAVTPNTVAAILEPVQGESGIIIPPKGWLTRIREICTRENLMLIADEIQSGLGRCGTMFACEHEQVRPDGMILGKALTGGMYPASAFVADDELMGVFKPGQHGSTYGGNPLACAVARAALRVIREEGMVANAAAMGERFAKGLSSIEAESILEVRQIGLWIGIELRHDRGGARPYCEELRNEGLLCKETHEHTIRVAPPLVVAADQVDWAVERLAKVFAKLG
jgi:ornithine--oxo-acid transaminase